MHSRSVLFVPRSQSYRHFTFSSPRRLNLINHSNFQRADYIFFLYIQPTTVSSLFHSFISIVVEDRRFSNNRYEVNKNCLKQNFKKINICLSLVVFFFFLKEIFLTQDAENRQRVTSRMNQMSKNKMRISLNCLELYSKRIQYMKVFNSFVYMYIYKKKIYSF